MIQDSMKKNIIDTKVIVAGGGLVGCVFAEALSSAGIDNVVIDTQNPRNNNKLSSDGRASAIALASKRVFENIGLWSRLEKFATPILDIRVSDHDSFQYLHFNHQEVGDDPLGFMLENSYIRNAQVRFLEKNNHTTFFAPNKVKELVRSDKETTAHLTDGTVIRAPLVVAADGRNSQMRKMFGIHLTKHSYNQSAIVCTIEHQRYDLPVLLVFHRVARSMSLSLAEQWVLVRITWHESLPSPLTLMCSPATFNFHADRYAQSVSKRTAIHDARHLVSLRIKLFN